MDHDELAAELENAGGDRESAERIIRRLVGRGAAVAPGLAAALRGASPLTTRRLRDALWRIGPAAFDAVLDAWTGTGDRSHRRELEHVLRGFDERCLPRYTAALSHPEQEIRQVALSGLESLGPAAAPAVPDVLPLLDDRDSYTRHKARKTVRAAGRDAGPALRDIRARGPARLRRPALAALALTGGEAAIGERDLRALERLVRIKTAHEVPRSLPDHWWLAVPGERYEGLFEVMGLHDRRPCTIAMGLSAMENDTVRLTDDDGRRRAVHRVFVTPELDGWRLVYADTPLWEMTWGVDGLLCDLGAACGQAQFFLQEDNTDGAIWGVAEGGVLRRRYWRHEDPEWRGEPMDWERPLDEDRDPDPGELEDREPNATLETGVDRAARALSVHPADIGEDTPVRGHGWLAVTREGVGHGPFTGILEI